MMRRPGHPAFKVPGTWLPDDLLLLEAYRMCEDMTCPGCGQPAWLSHGLEHAGEWTVKTVYCMGCAARESYVKGLKSDPPAGQKLSLINNIFRAGWAPSTRRRRRKKKAG